ncbi:MAG: c-type cytochrome [Acidobacteria bacterium]|nr:c-type cytochrome [Acidobacteriota bacterium]
MTKQNFRFLISLVFTVTLAVFALVRQPDANAQGGNPFDTGGRDDKPAGEVFKNVQTLKNMPAGRLVGVMNGWTKALGVKCNHCHTLGAWEKEDAPAKQIARDMVALTSRINGESLKEIKNLKSERPSISCYTCHRGAVKPETAPAAPAQPK